MLAKDEIKIKSQWDDEDLEEEVKEEEKPKPVCYTSYLCRFKCITDVREGRTGITEHIYWIQAF